MYSRRMLKQDSSIDTVAEDSPIRPQLLQFRSDVYYVIIYYSRPPARPILFVLFVQFSYSTPLLVTPLPVVLLRLPCT
jgi:hypothetical protein